MKKLLLILIMTSLMMPMMMAATQTMKIYPSNDAFVRAGSWANTNFGNSSWADTLRLGYEGSFDKERSFIMFNLSNLSGKQVSSLKLSLKYSNRLGSPIVQLYNSTTNWNENTLTWNNQPSISNLISTYNIGTTEDRVEFNINSYNASIVSFALKESSEGTGVQKMVQFVSKDYDTSNADDYLLWPYLEVVYDDGSNCQTTADTSGDGNIAFNEIVGYVSEWKRGNVSFQSLINAISFWKAGVGC